MIEAERLSADRRKAAATPGRKRAPRRRPRRRGLATAATQPSRLDGLLFSMAVW